MSRERILALYATCFVLRLEQVGKILALWRSPPDEHTADRTEHLHEHTIYPYVHTLSNVPDRAAALRPITIPDVMPSAIPKSVNFSLVAGALSRSILIGLHS